MNFTKLLAFEAINSLRNDLIKKQEGLIIECLRENNNTISTLSDEKEEYNSVQFSTHFLDNKIDCNITKVYVNYKNDIYMNGLSCGTSFIGKVYPENYQDVLLYIKYQLENNSKI